MIVVMQSGASQRQIDHVIELIESLGLRSHVIVGTERTVIAALGEKGVQVGRLFPALPTHLRVTVGTPEEMRRFTEAFHSTMA